MSTITLGRLFQGLGAPRILGVALEAAGAGVRLSVAAVAVGALVIGSAFTELVGREDQQP